MQQRHLENRAVVYPPRPQASAFKVILQEEEEEEEEEGLFKAEKSKQSETRRPTMSGG